MSRSIKTAWGEEANSAEVKNAYYNIIENDVIINLQGEIIGKATTYRARCTATSPGSVHLLNYKNENIWISGEVVDLGQNTWIVTNNTMID